MRALRRRSRARDDSDKRNRKNQNRENQPNPENRNPENRNPENPENLENPKNPEIPSHRDAVDDGLRSSCAIPGSAISFSTASISIGAKPDMFS
jgi:hypothetical protein